jgi:tetratricopeptide (TPR) repeat protein
MNKLQWIVVTISVALFFTLWLGFETKNKDQQTTDLSRTIQGEATSFSTLLEDAKEHLSGTQAEQFEALERASSAANQSTAKSEALKSLSGFWYRFGNIPIAGGYADSVAILEGTPNAWSVAGGTYYQGLVAAKDNQLIRTYCASKAVKAFESAASLASENPEHRVNLALVYAENPPPDNPMQAVLMLKDLETKYPNEPSVYNALGRLAIKTNQWDRAIQRLEKAMTLDPNNSNTPCLLAKAYEGSGNMQKAQEMAVKCRK